MFSSGQETVGLLEEEEAELELDDLALEELELEELLPPIFAKENEKLLAP